MRKVNLHIAAAVCVLIMTLAGPARAVTHYVNPGQSIQAAINDANDGDEIEVAPGTYSEDINFNGKAVRLYSSGGPEVTTIGSVLLEDFSDCDYAGWEICDQGNNGAPSVWSAGTGEMVQTSNICTVPLTDPNMLGTYAWWGAGTSWTEYQVTLSMKSDDDDAMGVMFRYQNPNSYYRFAWLKQDHSQPVGRRQLVKIQDGQYAVLDEDDVPYTTGTEYEVKIVVSGPDIEVFIDDVSVLSASDSAITHGSVALYCWGNEGTYFDNIEIMLPMYHVVQCISGEDANTILEGFTIIGGNANGPDPNDQCGGGMLNFLSSPTVTGCTFRDNTTLRGGGMYNNASSPTVTYCTFRDNSADIGGGGIYNGNNSSPTVTNCTFTRNSADYGGGMCNINNTSFVVINCNFNDNTADVWGGGMYSNGSSANVANCTFSSNEAVNGGGMYNRNSSNPTVSDCNFSENSAVEGGGMYNNASSPTVTNCTFTGNTASSGTYGGGGMFNNTSSNPIVTNCTFTGNTVTANGGGMYNFQNSNPTVTCCTFSGNSAGSGGGMYNNTSNPIVTSCTFTGHTVTANGGGMFNVKSSPKVINCTFSGNSAGSGSGMYNSNTSSPTVTNCILWGDEPDEISNDATSSANVTYSDVQGGWLGMGNIDADPCFVNAAGGDLRLSSSFSPCVDAGDNSVPGLPATDLEGNSRVWDGDGDGNSVVDMGAYELGAPKLIRNKMSQRWYVCIQMAIDDSKDGDEIEVAPGTFYEAINFKGKVVRLYSSGGPEVTTIDGTGHYHVVQCVSGEGPNTILEGFTITGGNANGPTDADICGGGMYNYNSSPTVTNCTFSGNNAEDYGYGGGMYNEFSSPRVADCTFSSNEAGVGGGMYNNTSSPTVINCTFTGNTNIGMYNYDRCSPTVTNCTFTGNTIIGMGNYMYSSPTVTNCTFTGNTGGGMWNCWYSSPKVTNCTFSGNTTSGDGGGISNDSYSSLTVTGCMFIGNTAHYGGGMYIFYESELTVTNCTFSGNSASYGGGMYICDDVRPILTNCTFTGNIASDSGGGMYVDYQIFELTVTNCLFWGDEPDEISKVAGSSAIVTYSDIEGGWTGIGNIDADPCFVDTHNPDPRLRSLRLKPDSPCIDAGDTTAVPDGIFGDVDGNPRGVDYPQTPDTGISIFGVTVDIGAYEFQLCQTPGDINCDGVVDFKDVAILAGNWMAGTERAFIFFTNTDNNGIYSFIELNSNTSYGVSSFARGHISSSEAVMTGASQDNHAPSGKLLGVDFILTHLDCLYADDDAPGDPNPGDPAFGDPLENGSIEHPFDSIQEAIDAAINGDEIEVAPGTYNEAINFKGKAVRLYGSDGPAVTTINANGLNSSVVTCKMGEDANTIFEGFTITGGNNNYGGGMYNENSSPTVTNCTFSGNTAYYYDGGGMLNNASSPTVTNCTFSGNTANDNGGGMYNMNNSSPTVINCTFSGNSAEAGGGMFNFLNSSPTVTNCTFSNNSVPYDGGVMYNSHNSSPTVTSCTFTGNTGGGMNNFYYSSPTVINCTFSGNSAGCNGGGMFNYADSSPTVINCTFSGNSASYGGGMYNYADSSPTMTNCIFWGDTPDEFYNYQSNPIVTYSDVAGGWPDANNTNIDADPLFVDVNNPDPNLWNLRLQPDSPCIDAGDTTAVDGIFADADWNLRGLDDPASPDRGVSVSGVTVDMGAYEFQLCRIAGDVNCDGVVNFKDLVVLCDNWLASTEPE